MKHALPLLVVFLLGLALGWFFKSPETAPESTAQNAQRSTQRISNRSRHTADKQNPTIGNLGKLAYNNNELTKQLEGIEASQFPHILEAFKARAGLKGLHYKDERIFKKTLLHWYKLDPTAALAWTAALKNDHDRTAFLKDILGAVLKDDFDHALALSQQYLTKPDGQVDFPYGMMQAASKKSKESLISLCKLTTYKGSSATGSSLQYPAGFDFKSVLNTLADHQASLAKGERMNQVPSNLLEEWAKRNPKEAYEWVLLGKDLSFNEGVEDFIEGYAAVASAEELGTFVGQVFDPEQKNYKGIKQAMIEAGTDELLSSFIQHAPAGISPLEHKSGILESIRGNSGSDPDRARHLILKSMSADERSQLFLESSRIFYYSEQARQRLADSLISLGHNKEEVSRILPVIKK